ncbi:hypothetical protein IC617_11400 [Neiella sp. HB171785]|uniref:Uncharacterized protein n=1 Tax=Neiella litorisoli TaxID=2771431 RepID=A0A8J6QHU3_9GAMM|nr:hypothetical protein [Neiella litorisoli]MBD1390035.1 hypothetical protein [Neiella litorisoli]
MSLYLLVAKAIGDIDIGLVVVLTSMLSFGVCCKTMKYLERRTTVRQ